MKYPLDRVKECADEADEIATSLTQWFRPDCEIGKMLTTLIVDIFAVRQYLNEIGKETI